MLSPFDPLPKWLLVIGFLFMATLAACSSIRTIIEVSVSATYLRAVKIVDGSRKKLNKGSNFEKEPSNGGGRAYICKTDLARLCNATQRRGKIV